jgi:hypothetical protein
MKRGLHSVNDSWPGGPAHRDALRAEIAQTAIGRDTGYRGCGRRGVEVQHD